MRNVIKSTAASVLTCTLIATTVGIATAQTYNPSYSNNPYNKTNGTGYNDSQYQTNQNYTQQNYSQPQNYSQQQNYQPLPENTYNQYVPQQPVNNMPPLQGRVVTVPVGTMVNTVVTSQINSQYLTTGDSVNIALGSDFYFNGVLIAPANSTVSGNVVICEKAGLTGKNGKLKIRFTNILTPRGQRIPISGKIATEDGTGLLTGGTNKDRVVGAAKNVAVGSGVGALAGTIFGPLSGGKAGKGAAMGTAVGAGLGLGKTLIKKGKDIIIPSGTRLNLQLDQPLTVNPAQSSPY